MKLAKWAQKIADSMDKPIDPHEFHLRIVEHLKERLEKPSRKTPEGPAIETTSPSYGEAVGESTGTVK